VQQHDIDMVGLKTSQEIVEIILTGLHIAGSLVLAVLLHHTKVSAQDDLIPFSFQSDAHLRTEIPLRPEEIDVVHTMVDSHGSYIIDHALLFMHHMLSAEANLPNL
jgi:hypothetical protein